MSDLICDVINYSTLLETAIRANKCTWWNRNWKKSEKNGYM